MTNRDSFEPVIEHGLRMGFSVLAKKELKEWFGTKTWWQQALLWSAILGLFGSVGLQDPEMGLNIFVLMAMIFPSIATIIIAHEGILEEKRSGSAEWVLSKPVSRESFLLSKFISVALGFSVSMILIPEMVVYLETSLFGTAPDFLVYLASLVPLMLWQIFLAFLTICFGVFFDEPGPVMALPFIFVFLGVNLGQLPVYGELGPWGLFRISLALLSGEYYPFTPVLITLVVYCVLVVLAIWRFKRHEF